MNGIEERLDQTVGGKYRIVKFMAEGGMGSVYEAQHLVVKRRFAVKFLRSDLMRRRDVLARFKLEAEAAGALESENIAAALDFGIATDGAPYIVMEYLDGVDLGRLLSVRGPLPSERAADLVQQACSGAQRAHEAGVLHRDLKPRNLFVCRRSDGTDLVKIVDFGVAKLQAGEAAHAVTRTGGLVGTPAYMSPEQARGEPEIDARTDVYALGVILYELLSGQTPHPGESYNAVIHHIATQPALRLEPAGRELPAALIRIVQRAIAPVAQDRHSSAAELGRELGAFARREAWPPVLTEVALDASSLDRTPLSSSEHLPPEPMPAPSARLAAGDVSRALSGPSTRGAERRRPAPIWLLPVMVLGIAAFFGISWSASRAAVPRTEPSAGAPAPSRVLTAAGAADVQPARLDHPEPIAPGAAPAPTSTALGTSESARVERRAPPAQPERRPARSRAGAVRAKVQRAGGARFDPRNPYD